jgi:ABC-2 type transport system permease protein
MRKRFQRLTALILKESLQLGRDRRTLMMILGLPLIQLFLFAYALRLTVDHLPTALVDQSHDSQSRALVESLANSGYFDMNFILQDQKQALQLIDSGQARAGIVIPPDFSAHIERGDASLLILLDGSDSFSLQAGFNAASSIAQTYNLNLITQKVARSGSTAASPGSLPQNTTLRVLYNPDSNDLVFILPGLAAILIQSLAVASAATAVVRERESGTLEQLLTTPARPIELMIGKLVPILALILGVMLVILGIGVFWFKVPFQGSFWTFIWLAILFIISSLGLGLLVSTIARTQKQAQQISNVLMLFSLLLSGFIYPRDNMAAIPKVIGSLLPVTYFMRIARGLITKGVGLSILWGDTLILLFYGLLIIGLATVTFRKRLD